MGSVIIGIENVRPSSPTPQNLRTYKFSMLDELYPILTSCILFFPNTLQLTEVQYSSISETTQKLQRSLSLILTRYYPLAGRVSSDGNSVDCNDAGVPFTVAKIEAHNFSDLAVKSDQKSLHFLLPCEISLDNEYAPDSAVALIKVSYFDCGGMAIGFAFEHKLMDAISIAAFIKSWAAVTRVGPTEAVCPNFIFQSFHPRPPGLPKTENPADKILKTGSPAVRHYVFDASAIASLKSGLKGATRVEAVTALIWKAFMAASLANNRSASVVTHAVNMRTRARPAFPPECFGNFARLTMAAAGNEEGKDLGVLAGKVREAISKIDGDYVDRLRGEDRLAGERENSELVWSPVAAIGKQPDFLFMTSWCGFGFYGIDFGWGKPSMLGRCDVSTVPSTRFVNSAWLTDSRGGDNGGVEAWVILDEKYMTVFENVDDLRAFAAHADHM